MTGSRHPRESWMPDQNAGQWVERKHTAASGISHMTFITVGKWLIPGTLGRAFLWYTFMSRGRKAYIAL